jgi:hypothetical protein
MPIRFKCPNPKCKKGLSVKDELGGKKGICPVCKTPLTIPPRAATAAEIEALAAAAFAEEQAAPAETAPVGTIDFDCPFCGEHVEVSAELSGKQAPCPNPECKRIVKVPLLKETKPKDWRQIKTGPTAALMNQPEQLPEAWGTELKTRVSGTALLEAEAVPIEVEPIGVAGWLKRIFYTVTSVAAVLAVVLLIKNNYRRQFEKASINDILAFIDKKDPAKEEVLPRPWKGELYRGIVEFYVQDKKPEEANKYFVTAQPLLRKDVAKGRDVLPFDVDMILTRLTLTLVDLGGSEQEAIFDKEKMLFEEVQKRIRRCLDNFSSEDACAAALRELAERLRAKKQERLAIGWARDLHGQRAGGKEMESVFIAQEVALLLGQSNEAEAHKRLPPPNPKKDKDLSPFARRGHVEGLVRQGKVDDAQKLNQTRGKPLHQFQAALAAAAAAVALERPADAQSFVHDAQALAKNLGRDVPAFLRLELVKVTARGDSDSPEKAREMIASLPKEVQGWAELDLLELSLTNKKEFVPFAEAIKPFPDQNSLPCALAWEALARHNARLGLSGQFQEAVQSTLSPPPPRMKPFIILGQLLGEQDAGK